MTTSDTRSTDSMVREMVLTRQRRRRARLVSLMAGVGIVAAALLGAGLVRATDSSAGKAPSRVPTGVAKDKAGLVFSDGPVRVDLYVDYLCPECRKVEQAIAPELNTLKASGKVTLVYHPVGFLDDHSSPGGYSTRAAAAAACAADRGRFEQYSTVLFDRQPAERGPGLSEAQLVAAGRDVGITGDAFASCVHDGGYAAWVKYVSDVAASHSVALTPIVMVNDVRVDVTGQDPAASLTTAVREASR